MLNTMKMPFKSSLIASSLLLAASAAVIPGSVLAQENQKQESQKQEKDEWADFDSWGDKAPPKKTETQSDEWGDFGSGDWGDTTQSGSAGGTGNGDDWDSFESESTRNPITGFVEAAYGRRLSTDPVIDRPQTLSDLRFQFQWDYDLEASTIKTRADLYYDGVKNNTEIQIRELAWHGSLAGLGDWGSHFDAKVGQQVLTWGTGDYLFLNDLFPKDWQSFFSGRDDEYLKAPSFSAKLSGYFDLFNFDFVVTPRFTPDNYINGQYYSFFSPQAGQNIAPEFDIPAANRPTDAEYAVRLYKSFDSTEVALYGYSGYSPLPESADVFGRPKFSDMNVYGFSVVSPLGDGIAKFEYARQNALEDPNGDNPLEQNSMSKVLVGYEQELYPNLTGSLQWYMERIHDHEALVRTSPWPQYEQEKVRNVLTTQVIYRALRQTLTLNLFSFYSPTEKDGYTKFRASYSPVDDWSLSSGFNWFYGKDKHTFFNQFEDTSNVYFSFRYFYSF